ncbi:hypothetical protein FRC10_004338, partial [Ceratobasidium sp. 414]
MDIQRHRFFVPLTSPQLHSNSLSLLTHSSGGRVLGDDVFGVAHTNAITPSSLAHASIRTAPLLPLLTASCPSPAVSFVRPTCRFAPLAARSLTPMPGLGTCTLLSKQHAYS